MNRIFKTKFNYVLGISTVCSEFAKQKNKSATICLMSTAILFSPLVHANTMWNGEHFNGSIDNKYLSTTANTYNILLSSSKNYVMDHTQTLMQHQGLGKKTLNYVGDLDARGEALQLLSNNSGTIVNYTGNISITSNKYPVRASNTFISNTAGIVNFEKDVTLDSTFNFTSDTPNDTNNLSSLDKNGAYNTAVSVRGTGATATEVFFKNLNVTLKDHTQGINKCMKSVFSFCIVKSKGTVTASGMFGLRVAKSNSLNNKQATSVTISELFDFKTEGDRSLGIYISGNKGAGVGDEGMPKVTLKDSNFILKASSNDKDAFTGFWDSHAIKIGRGRDGEGSGILISTGNMNIDTTQIVEGGGIKMLGNSQFFADADTASTTIKTKGYALEIGGVDDQNSNLTFDFVTSNGLAAKFNNAVFSTTGTSGDPRVATNQQTDVLSNSLNKRGITRKDLIFVDQGQQNVQLVFSGDKTNLTAHPDGYIVNVSGNYTRDGYRFFNTAGVLKDYSSVLSSSVNFSATDAGMMKGLVYKGNVKRGENAQILDTKKRPLLNISLSNGFKWYLQKSGTNSTAVFDNLILNSGAIINAFSEVGGGDFILKAQTFDAANQEMLGNITNNGGIISLVNGKYNDILRLNGNYIGSNNAVIKLDSLWNTPGGENGEDFSSDTIQIKGTATGSTQVIPVKADGTENYFEGNIVALATKALASLPIITVSQDNQDSNLGTVFRGSVPTNGIGMAYLASRLNRNNMREYYWSLINTPIPPKEDVLPELPINQVTPPITKIPDNAPTVDVLPELPISQITPPITKIPDNAPTVDVLPELPINQVTPPITKIPDNAPTADIASNTSSQPLSWEVLSLKPSIPALVMAPEISLIQTVNGVLSHRKRFDFERNTNRLRSHLITRSMEPNNKFWINANINRQTLNGLKRFKAISNVKNIQLGYNFIEQNSGLFLSHSLIKSNFYDKALATSYTGKVNTHALNLAFSKNFTFNYHSYIDLVEQVSLLKNKYHIKNGTNAKQNGFANTVSLELGRSFLLPLNKNKHLAIELQTQLMYTYLKLNSVKLDQFTNSDNGHFDNVVWRTGSHFTYYQDNIRVSTDINFYRTLSKDKYIMIGPDVVNETYAKNRVEIQTQLTTNINKNNEIMAGVNYSKAIHGKGSKSYGGNIGYKFTW